MSNTDSSNGEQVGTSHKKILSGFTEEAELLGYSKLALVALFAPALVMYQLTQRVIPPEYTLLGYVLTGGCVLAALGVIQATPDHSTLREEVGAIVRYYTQPGLLLYDAAPEDSGIDQPRGRSLRTRLGQLGRVNLAGFGRIPYLGGDPDVDRCQDLVPSKRPLEHEYAIQQDDGSLVAAIRITPANLSTASDQDWARRVERLADILSSTVEGKTQWYNPMRAVDYRSRYDTYRAAEEAFRRDAASSDPDLDTSDILADICQERAAVVHRYQETSFVREHYYLVKVEPEETVFADAEESGGLGNVSGVGKLLTKWELQQRSGSEESVEQMLDTLQRRTENLASALRSIDGIKATPISSMEFSKVTADYLRAANIHAYGDFAAFVRQSPSPRHSEAEPAGETEYRHITNTMPGRDYGRPATRADGRGASHASHEVETDAGRGGGIRGLLTGLLDQGDDSGAFDAAAVNEGVDIGIAETDSELEAHYKNALAPYEFDRQSSPNHVVIDEEVYSATVAVRDWPANPRHGLLRSVMEFSPPGVGIVASTHMDKEPKAKARRAISEVVDILEDKATNAEQKKYYPTVLARQFRKKAAEANDVLEALLDTEHDLFESNTYISIRAPDAQSLRTTRKKLQDRLQNARAAGVPMKHNHDTGFLTTGPFVDDQAHQPVKMLADGLAAMFSWSSHNLFEPGGISLGIHRDQREPTVFDLWSRGSGYSIGIFGKVGNGKTTTLSRILLRLKLLTDYIGLLLPGKANTLMVMVDPMREFEGLTWLFGGERIEIGGETNINIMHYEDSEAVRAKARGDRSPREDAERRAISLIEDYYSLREIPFGKDEKRGVWEKAIKKAYDDHGSGEDSPYLQIVIENLAEMANHPERYVDERIDDVEEARDDLKKSAYKVINHDIEPFAEGGEYHHLTQPNEIDFSESNVWFLDLHRYENEEDAGGFFMQILMNLVNEEAKRRSADGGRTVTAMDEAHYVLNNSENLESLKQIVLHHRHYDHSLIFSTQSIEEFFAGGELTSAGEIIFDNLVAKIYHYTDELDAEWLDELGLTEREAEFIGKAETGEALVQIDKKGTYPIRVDMSDGQNPREFAAVKYDPNTHGEDFRAYLREYRDADGNDPCEWTADLSPEASETTAEGEA